LLVIPSEATEPAVVLPPFSVLQLSGRRTMMLTAQPILHQLFPASLILLVIPSENDAYSPTNPASIISCIAYFLYRLFCLSFRAKRRNLLLFFRPSAFFNLAAGKP
jgi:hypothetical protein